MSEQSGKIHLAEFEESIQGNLGIKRNEVAVGPGFGIDTSIIKLDNNKAIALTSDPLSLIPGIGLQESAWISVVLLANDIVTTGFPPMYAQFVLNLPVYLNHNDFKEYWKFIHHYCHQFGISITGGHTGFIEGQNSTISGGGTFITIGDYNKMLTSNKAQVGDAILVTKSCAIISASILSMSFPETVVNKAGKETYHKVCNYFYSTSVVNDAITAVGKNREFEGINAMHDVTEGGVLGAIYELAYASDKGAIVFNNQLPIDPHINEVCKIFSLDPRYIIGAGSMIMTCKQEHKLNVIQRLTNAGIACSEVGTITEKEKGIKIIENDVVIDLPYTDADPYWEAFFNAFKSGWK